MGKPVRHRVPARKGAPVRKPAFVSAAEYTFPAAVMAALALVFCFINILLTLPAGALPRFEITRIPLGRGFAAVGYVLRAAAFALLAVLCYTRKRTAWRVLYLPAAVLLLSCIAVLCGSGHVGALFYIVPAFLAATVCGLVRLGILAPSRILGGVLLLVPFLQLAVSFAANDFFIYIDWAGGAGALLMLSVFINETLFYTSVGCVFLGVRRRKGGR